MYGLLGYKNIWPRYYYLKMWNLTVQKIGNIEKNGQPLKLSIYVSRLYIYFQGFIYLR